MSSWLIKKSTKRVFPKQIPSINTPINNIEIKKNTQSYNENEIIFNIINKLNSLQNNVESIPKIAFTFWEGSQFSYLHYLTIKSFSHYNPDFKIFIYSTNNPTDINSNWNTGEHNIKIINNLFEISLLKNVDNVYFIKINLEDYFPNISNISAIHKADIIRIIKLKEHGGIWFDCDILFYKRVPDDLLNLKKNNIGIFSYENRLPIGFIFSHPNTPLLDYLFVRINNILNGNIIESDKYQQFGVRIWTNLLKVPIINNYITIFPTEVVYSYVWNNVNQLYNTNNDINTDKTIGIHWYNGAEISKKYINYTNFNNINPNTSVMNKYVHKVLYDMNESKE
jgi:hypothetical protein